MSENDDCSGQETTHVLLQSVKNYEATRHNVPGNICQRVDSSVPVPPVDDGSVHMDDPRGRHRTRKN